MLTSDLKIFLEGIDYLKGIIPYGSEIVPTGSRVYGSPDEDSDYDYLILASSLAGLKQEFEREGFKDCGEYERANDTDVWLIMRKKK